MKKIKRFAALALAGVMTAAMVFPSMADEQVPGVVYEKYCKISEDTEYIERYAYAPVYSFPSWHWINGYCYYYTDYIGGNKLTNCVTPDGYTVDELGRWTIDGIPQSNGYTGYVMGTDILYAGLDDAQRWEVMEAELEKVFIEHVKAPITYDHQRLKSFSTTPNNIYSDFTNNQGNGGSFMVSYDAKGLDPDTYTLFMEDSWNDVEALSVSGYSEMLEKVIKLVVGDHIGQELFNDMKAAGDLSESTETAYVPIFDENGKFQFTDDSHILSVQVQQSDGLNPARFDYQKWNGRKTDYGKTIMIEYPYDPYYMWGEYRILVMD